MKDLPTVEVAVPGYVRIGLFLLILFFPFANATARTDYVFYHYFFNSQEDLQLISETQSLFWSSPQDLTAMGVAPALDPSSALVGFGISSAPYVFYFDSNQQLTATFFANGVWHSRTLAGVVNIPTPLSTTLLTGVGVGNTTYVFYVGSNQHVVEVWGTDPHWNSRDLTTVTGSPLAYTNTGIFALHRNSSIFNSQRYDVAYETQNFDGTLTLVDLFWPNSDPWRFVLMGGSYALPSSTALSGWVWGNADGYLPDEYFSYVNVSQMAYKVLPATQSTWHDVCPFSCNGSTNPAPSTSSSSVSAIEENNWSGDTFYMDGCCTGSDLKEVRWSQHTNSWSLTDLSTNLSIGVMPSNTTPTTEFTGLSGIELFWVDAAPGGYGNIREAVMPPNQLNETWTGYNLGFPVNGGSTLAGFSR